uniref:Uncharacterized protein n=1 Tax=Oncorhynchus tshawytscha TaxID=74940 RepID=A0A8C8FA11_ONCTS
TITMFGKENHDWPGYSLELFNYPKHYSGDLEGFCIPHGIMDRTECLARNIMAGYQFCANLVESLKALSCNSHHTAHTNDQSTEDLQTIGAEDLCFLTGKVSSTATKAKTMKTLLKQVEAFRPKRIKAAGLLVKRVPNGSGCLPD